MMQILILPFSVKVSSDSNNDTWLVSYSREQNYTFGFYVIRVSVCRWFIKNFICTPSTSVGEFFTLTGLYRFEFLFLFYV